MTYFWTYYLLCLAYCFFQISKRWRTDTMPGGLGVTPALDSLAIVILCWVLAPVDIFLTWVRIYTDAENARRKHNKIS